MIDMTLENVEVTRVKKMSNNEGKASKKSVENLYKLSSLEQKDWILCWLCNKKKKNIFTRASSMHAMPDISSR